MRRKRGTAKSSVRTRAKPSTRPSARNEVELELAAQVAEDRDDPAPYLAYADWLQSQKDPRGELIVIQHALAHKPRDKTLLAAEAACLDQHRDLLPKTLRALVMLAPERGQARCEVVWRFGFLDRVRIACHAREQPLLPRVIADLLAHPSAELLRGLTIGAIVDDELEGYDEEVDAIAVSRHAMLESLEFAPGPGDETRIDDASPLLGLPMLRELVLRARTIDLGGALEHVNLARLAVIARESFGGIDRLAGARLPRLAQLELEAPRLSIARDDLLAMLDGKRLPALRRLALRRTRNTGAILDALLAAPSLSSLEHVALTDGDLADHAVASLIRHAPHLAHLKSLDLAGNKLSPAMADRIAKRVGPRRVRLARQQVTVADTIASAVGQEPDGATIAAARRTARDQRWTRLARDGDVIWGELDGEAVFARLGTTNTGCSCASAKPPCPHVLALLLVSSSRPDLEELEMPDDVFDRVQSRRR